jgi:hypothetical protein
LKDAKRLQKILEPQSELHRKRDLEQLKRYVLEIEKLLGRTPVLGEVNGDLKLALRGIVEVRKPPKPKLKPVVQLDDNYSADGWSEEYCEADREVGSE